MGGVQKMRCLESYTKQTLIKFIQLKTTNDLKLNKQLDRIEAVEEIKRIKIQNKEIHGDIIKHTGNDKMIKRLVNKLALNKNRINKLTELYKLTLN